MITSSDPKVTYIGLISLILEIKRLLVGGGGGNQILGKDIDNL